MPSTRAEVDATGVVDDGDGDDALGRLRRDLRREHGAMYARMRSMLDEDAREARTRKRLRRALVEEFPEFDAYAIDVAVAELKLTGPSVTEAWLQDGAVWPDLAKFERERLHPRIRERAGIGLEQMPSLRTERIDQLLQAVASVIAQRDAEFLVRFEQFLTTQVLGRANERLRGSDFAGAEALWTGAMRWFCDGSTQPYPERLAEQTRSQMEQKRKHRSDAALSMLAQEEDKSVRPLQSEVSNTVANLLARLSDGADPWVVSEAL